MGGRTKVSMERPVAGKLNFALQLPGLTQHVQAAEHPAERNVSRFLVDVSSLLLTGRGDVATDDTTVLTLALNWLSRQHPRTKFVVRGEAGDGSRWSLQLKNGETVIDEPKRPKAKLATAETAAALDGAANARTYAASTRYAVREIIDHPTLGRGLVTKVIDNKIIVQFADNERMLVHAKA